MATNAFEEIAETFDFLDDWEDRYRHVIELGKAMPALEDALRVPATKVDGCASQVWLHPEVAGGAFHFRGDSDAMIVRGLIAVLAALYNGVPLEDVAKVDARGSTPYFGSTSDGTRYFVKVLGGDERSGLAWLAWLFLPLLVVAWTICLRFAPPGPRVAASTSTPFS